MGRRRRINFWRSAFLVLNWIEVNWRSCLLAAPASCPVLLAVFKKQAAYELIDKRKEGAFDEKERGSPSG